MRRVYVVGTHDTKGEELAFLAGLVAAPIVYTLARALPSISFDASLPVIGLAGVVVGIGTRYGAGCTSGHGICGISRLSPRSIAATLCFMPVSALPWHAAHAGTPFAWSPLRTICSPRASASFVADGWIGVGYGGASFA